MHRQTSATQDMSGFAVLIWVRVCMHYAPRCPALSALHSAAAVLGHCSLWCTVYLIVHTVVAICYTSPCATISHAASAVANSIQPGDGLASLV